MRLLPSDPDVETIVGRIKNRDIDLQPDFQRGEVWSQAKQRRLVDSILRDWHVPPIHIVQNSDTSTQDVLDGQQRLAAIRDFVAGLFAVDGNIEPIDHEIQKLHGKRYAELPPKWKRQFDQFTIRVFRIVDFAPEEPAELFFRLNQPVALTSAEQRNAFYGPIRIQVKELVHTLSEVRIGFSNSRMALDDVVSRLCLSVERGSIATKVTAPQLAERYRAQKGFSSDTLTLCTNAVRDLKESEPFWDCPVKLNKATLFSWLWLAACAGRHFPGTMAPLLGKTISNVEMLRTQSQAEESPALAVDERNPFWMPPPHLAELFRLYIDRSTSRVSDVSSVIARDVFLWTLLGISAHYIANLRPTHVPYFDTLLPALQSYIAEKSPSAVALVDSLMTKVQWGGVR
jgi:hypothetical protein